MTMKLGDLVKYVDADKATHNALVIHVHEQGQDVPPMLNLVYIDPAREAPSDSYGEARHLETSVVHESPDPAVGQGFWHEDGVQSAS